MKWRKYHAPRSGISAYAEGPNYILIEFKTGERYRYDTSRPGKKHVAEMKALAHRTSGLTAYINQNIRDNYAAKLDQKSDFTRIARRAPRTPQKRAQSGAIFTRREKARRSSRVSGA